jgi:hypothetical protein
MKTCPGCGTDKPLTDYYADRTAKKLGVGTYCKPCSIERAAEAYQRRKAIPKPTPSIKGCATCGFVKPATEYWRAAASRDGLQPECKDCRKARVRAARYGLALDEYEQMLANQDGVCAICHRDRPLVVDHCHDSDEVRGLLCSPCNTAIGLLGEDLDRFLDAVAYLASSAPREVVSA